MTSFGYIREGAPMSTRVQARVLLEYECQQIIVGKKESSDQTELIRLLAKLTKGDCLFVFSLNVLGETEQEIISVLSRISKKGVGIISWSNQLDTARHSRFIQAYNYVKTSSKKTKHYKKKTDEPFFSQAEVDQIRDMYVSKRISLVEIAKTYKVEVTLVEKVVTQFF